MVLSSKPGDPPGSGLGRTRAAGSRRVSGSRHHQSPGPRKRAGYVRRDGRVGVGESQPSAEPLLLAPPHLAVYAGKRVGTGNPKPDQVMLVSRCLQLFPQLVHAGNLSTREHPPPHP